MSVFKKVVSRVRDFFLEPEPPAPPPRPSSAAPAPSLRAAVEKPDAFEWEPPEKRRAPDSSSSEASPPRIPWSGESAEGDARAVRPAVFSARNFSTEELQRSSVLDIVAGVARVPTRPLPPPPPRVAEIPGVPDQLLEELAMDVPAAVSAPTPASSSTAGKRPAALGKLSPNTVEIAPLLVEEIPRPAAGTMGFASILRDAALKVDERDLSPEPDGPESTLASTQTSEARSPSWTLATRSMAGIEVVPPPFALDSRGASAAGVRRSLADDPTRTGELERPSSLLLPNPPQSTEPDREVVGVNTGEIDRNLAGLAQSRSVVPPSEPPRPLLF